jgi:NADPH-dependent 2,4-dienoyl-CoA reductase/sulfur reductase-like enzyme
MHDIIIIGGGAAGLSAAKEAYDPGLKILIIEREAQLGGILRQCIHNGFGIHKYNLELTGPEYAQKTHHLLDGLNIEVLMHSTVVDIIKDDHFELTIMNPTDGEFKLTAKAIIIASGCYEKTRSQILLPGDRPAGIMSAGNAQRYLNLDGYMVGKKVFILGSGDIGLIMARRMTLEGAEVLGVAELMPYSNGLTRNIAQCLDDFDIPLYLSHTITDIVGKDRLEKIVISEVDQAFNPVPGTEKTFDVDTLLLSVGLVPDIQMFESLKFHTSPITKGAVVDQHLQTSVEGCFACGNALHVHDLVDWVSEESEKAGRYAKMYVKNELKAAALETVEPGENVRYVLPQRFDYENQDETVQFSLRTTLKAEKGTFKVFQGETLIFEKKARHLAPAEMEHIKINKDQLTSNAPIRISLEVMV